MTYLLVAIICTSMMVPGFISNGYQALRSRKKEHVGVALFTAAALMIGVTRTVTVGIALLRPNLVSAFRWNTAYEISLQAFLPVTPLLINAFLSDSGTKLKRVNRILVVVGLAISMMICAVIILNPPLYQGIYSLDEIPDPISMGRGPKGPMYWVSSLFFLAYTLYTGVVIVTHRFRYHGNPYFTTLSIGLITCILFILTEILAVFTGRFPIIHSVTAYSRLLVALTIFSITAVIAVAQKSLADSEQVERDREELRRHSSALAQAAYEDRMTGLANRQALFRDLPELFRPGRILMMVDIDNLAFVNSYYGHDTGDQLIKNVGAVCRNHCPPGGRTYRVNADLYVLAIQGNPTSAQRIADSILQAIRDISIPEAGDDRFTASVGISTVDNAGDPIGWSNQADSALLKAKTMRDCAVVFDPAFHDDEARRHAIIAGLRHTLDAHGLQAHYQPIVTHEGMCIGTEALVRWNHPSLGPISPDEFIPLAEATGLISRLTQFMIRRSIEDLKSIKYSRPLFVNVNLSSRDLIDGSLENQLDGILSEFGTDQITMGFEITETALMADIEESIKRMKRIRDRGFLISLDDFGTGYSSLSYLKRLPLNKLKIDRTFVDDLLHDEKTAMLMETIIDLGNKLNLELIFEGVENEEQHSYLLERNARYFQGYYFSKPLAIKELREWLSSD